MYTHIYIYIYIYITHTCICELSAPEPSGLSMSSGAQEGIVGAPHPLPGSSMGLRV